MESVEEFLAHAIELEREAALRFGQLADAMASAGNREVAKLFRRLADYSQMHLNDARSRAGFRDMPAMTASDYRWPDIESPETAAIWAADPFIGREQALQVAIEAESASHAYYLDIMQRTDDPEIRGFAKEFAEEEAQHVAELQRWMALHLSGAALPAGH